MTKKKIKKKEDTSTKTLRPDQVLIEHFDGKFDLLIDGYVALGKKIDSNHHEFKEFVLEVKDKFKVVFEEFGEIHDKFEVAFEELHDIRKELKSVKI